MLNQVVLVGRIKELKENTLTIAVSRSYKNEKGQYETDMIRVNLYGKIQENIVGFCVKGDIVGIKGRVETGNKIIAEKVTFLSSKRKED